MILKCIILSAEVSNEMYDCVFTKITHQNKGKV